MKKFVVLFLIFFVFCSSDASVDELVEKAKEIYSKNINIKIDLNNANLDIVKISKIAKEYKGKCGLMFHMAGANGRMQRILAHNIKVSSSKSFLNQVREICGKKNVWISE